jgi:hypothetical protein
VLESITPAHFGASTTRPISMREWDQIQSAVVVALTQNRTIEDICIIVSKFVTGRAVSAYISGDMLVLSVGTERYIAPIPDSYAHRTSADFRHM